MNKKKSKSKKLKKKKKKVSKIINKNTSNSFEETGGWESNTEVGPVG